MKSDHYYGPYATGYEAKRAHKPGWEREQAAIDEFVTVGPLLDVPFGTGRYTPIYDEKNIQFVGVDTSADMLAVAQENHPSAVGKVRIGDVKALPFAAGEFATVVCSRLMNWLYPEDFEAALRELARVAKTIVVSIRLGIPGKPAHRGNYTHDRNHFYSILHDLGLYIAGQKTISTASDGEFIMFKLRKPVWEDVQRQFVHHPDGTRAINRLAKVWTGRYALTGVELSESCPVRAEYWSASQLKQLIWKMAECPRADGQPNTMITDKPPRFTDGPVVVFKTQDETAMIDGRRRSNVWMKKPGRYPVLVIDASQALTSG